MSTSNSLTVHTGFTVPVLSPEKSSQPPFFKGGINGVAFFQRREQIDYSF
jgi:hypothetical protein